MLPIANFEQDDETLGSLSQVIPESFPEADLMDYTYQICSQMSA